MRKKWMMVILVVFSLSMMMADSEYGNLATQLKDLSDSEKIELIYQIGELGVQSDKYVLDLFEMSFADFPDYIMTEEDLIDLYRQGKEYKKPIELDCFEALVKIGENRDDFYRFWMKSKNIRRVYALSLLLETGSLDYQKLVEKYDGFDVKEQEIFRKWFVKRKANLPEEICMSVYAALLKNPQSSYYDEMLAKYYHESYSFYRPVEEDFEYHSRVIPRTNHFVGNGRIKALRAVLNKCMNGNEKERSSSAKLLGDTWEERAFYRLGENDQLESFIDEAFEDNRRDFDRNGNCILSREQINHFSRIKNGTPEKTKDARFRFHARWEFSKQQDIYSEEYKENSDNVILWRHLLGCSVVANSNAEMLKFTGDAVLPYLEDRLKSKSIADQILAVSTLVKIKTPAAAKLRKAYYLDDKCNPDLRAYVIARHSVPLSALPQFILEVKEFLNSEHEAIVMAAVFNLEFYQVGDVGEIGEELKNHSNKWIKDRMDLILGRNINQQQKIFPVDKKMIKLRPDKTVSFNYLLDGGKQQSFYDHEFFIYPWNYATYLNISPKGNLNADFWIPLLKGPAIRRKTLALDKLMRHGGAEDLDEIIPLLEDPDYLVRLSVVKLLINWEPSNLISVLINHLPNEKNIHVLSYMKRAFAYCLRKEYDPVQNEAAKQRIYDWLEDQGSIRREIAQLAMVHMNKQRAVEMFQKELEQPELILEKPLLLSTLHFYDEKDLSNLESGLYTVLNQYKDILRKNGLVLSDADYTALFCVMDSIASFKNEKVIRELFWFRKMFPENVHIYQDLARQDKALYDDIVNELGEPMDSNASIYFRFKGYFQPEKARIELIPYLDYPEPIAKAASDVLAFLNGFEPLHKLGQNRMLFERVKTQGGLTDEK